MRGSSSSEVKSIGGRLPLNVTDEDEDEDDDDDDEDDEDDEDDDCTCWGVDAEWDDGVDTWGAAERSICAFFASASDFAMQI